MADTPTPQEFNIRDYWQILVRRRWMIYTFVLITTVAAAVSSFVATPTYKASTTISIERSGARLMRQDVMVSDTSWLDYQNFYNTQYKIIESDRVLARAAENLRLGVRGIPGEKGAGSSTIAEFEAQLLGLLGRSRRNTEPEEPIYKFVKFLHGGLSVDPIRDSHLVQISFVSTEPKFAAEAANEIASAYQWFNLESKVDIAKTASNFFAERVNNLRTDIAADEKLLQDFAREHNLVTGDSNEAALKNYDDLRTKLSLAQAELAQAQAKFQAYQQGTESLEEVRANAHLMELASQVAIAEGSYRELEAKYGSQYPEVVSARSKMEGLKATLKTDTERVARQTIESARIDYQNKLNAVQNLGALFEQSRQIVDRFQGPYAEYLTKKKMVESKRATMNELLEKQNSMQISANMGESGQTVRVIDSAQTPRIVFKPKKKLNIMLGLLAGLFLGVAGAVVMEYVDNTLKTPDDVRQVLGLAVLGMIPAQDATPKEQAKKQQAVQKRTRTRGGDAATPNRDVDPALVTLQAPLSPTAEAYRELRTAILLATPGHPPRDLTVTSCQPSEGKTTTAINIAVALAQLGRRVLVVDTDLRRPRCHQVLRAAASRGVSTYLTGNSELRALIIPTSAERVYLLPAGPIPPNPAELLDADRFRQMVAELRADADFDHVIFDSPPTLSVVDPLLIGRHTEGTVLVIKSGFTSRESGRLGKEKLLSGRVNLLGVLLNAVSTEHVPYQYRYYRYGYSRKEDEETASGSDGAAQEADTTARRGA